MSVLSDFEKSNIYKKIGEYLMANPDDIPEEKAPVEEKSEKLISW